MSTKLHSDASGKSDDGGLEQVKCCLFCQSPNSHPTLDRVRDLFFEADEGHFQFLRCDDCRSLWLESRPAGDRLLRAYSSYYTHAQPQHEPPVRTLRALLKSAYIRSRYGRPSNPIDRLTLLLARAVLPDNAGIDLHHRYAPRPPARLLDYGCGSGEYLLRMERMGYSLSGVEYDPQLLTGLAGRGIRIEDVITLDHEAWAGTFDHITLAHVLEHVPDPVGLLGRLFTMLKPNGTLFVEVPNAEAAGLAVFGSNWRGLEAPRHFALPSPTALITALEQTGFAIERQPVDHSARRWVWQESLQACPPSERAAFASAMRAAPPETRSNAEFLTFVASRPA